MNKAFVFYCPSIQCCNSELNLMWNGRSRRNANNICQYVPLIYSLKYLFCKYLPYCTWLFNFHKGVYYISPLILNITFNKSEVIEFIQAWFNIHVNYMAETVTLNVFNRF